VLLNVFVSHSVHYSQCVCVSLSVPSLLDAGLLEPFFNSLDII